MEHSDKRSQKFRSAFQKVASAVKQMPIDVAVVNADENKAILTSHNVKTTNLPTLKLFLGSKSIIYKDPLGKDSMEDDAAQVLNWTFEEIKKFTIEAAGLKYKPQQKSKDSSGGKSVGQGPVELTEANFKSKVIDVSADTLYLVEFCEYD